ncbi:hypothetical protein VPNG_00838 [Cytospora leucostoma]|uniref:Uncharacterized protein n=1 Tax=Cytospora leucostoma TaxID=1230097 RepID=A0A423XM20_9PEZI|nr:hypothetical protein VPNG_00838 [Cytospora leucostoma]
MSYGCSLLSLHLRHRKNNIAAYLVAGKDGDTLSARSQYQSRKHSSSQAGNAPFVPMLGGNVIKDNERRAYHVSSLSARQPFHVGNELFQNKKIAALGKIGDELGRILSPSKTSTPRMRRPAKGPCSFFE